MNEGLASPAALAQVDGSLTDQGAGAPTTVPPPPQAAVRPSGWTGGRVTALVVGGLLVLISVGKLASGAVALWADGTLRDSGYVTTDIHEFTAAGSALTTEPIELGSPGVGWLYSEVVLGEVRIRVAPAATDQPVFVGIGPTDDVDRYLAGVRHTLISDFWGNREQVVGGGAPGSDPGTQDFWVASDAGVGLRSLTWEPANGSWSVVVMNADGRPGIDVRTDLGATMPALPWIGVALLLGGAVFLVGGGLLIVGAVRRVRRARTV